MSAVLAIQKRGGKPASHQGSWTVYPYAEKVLALVMDHGVFVQRGLTVQPDIFEVRRLEPAWILASSNRPTSPTNLRAHMRVTRIRARRANRAVSRFGNHRKQVRRVRRLGEPCVYKGFSRPTS